MLAHKVTDVVARLREPERGHRELPPAQLISAAAKRLFERQRNLAVPEQARPFQRRLATRVDLRASGW